MSLLQDTKKMKQTLRLICPIRSTTATPLTHAIHQIQIVLEPLNTPKVALISFEVAHAQLVSFLVKISLEIEITDQSFNVGLPTSHRRIVIALYNYNAREDTDVSFVKGDRMEVLDDTESDWWRVIVRRH